MVCRNSIIVLLVAVRGTEEQATLHRGKGGKVHQDDVRAVPNDNSFQAPASCFDLARLTDTSVIGFENNPSHPVHCQFPPNLNIPAPKGNSLKVGPSHDLESGHHAEIRGEYTSNFHRNRPAQVRHSPHSKKRHFQDQANQNPWFPVGRLRKPTQTCFAAMDLIRC